MNLAAVWFCSIFCGDHGYLDGYCQLHVLSGKRSLAKSLFSEGTLFLSCINKFSLVVFLRSYGPAGVYCHMWAI